MSHASQPRGARAHIHLSAAPVLALLPLFFLGLLGVSSQSTNACPVTSAQLGRVNWLAARPECKDTSASDFCAACTCAIGVALVNGLDAADVRVNGKAAAELAADVSDANIDQVTGVLTSCALNLGLELLSSGALSSGALAQLTSRCDIQAEGRKCYATAFAQATAANGPPPPPPGTASTSPTAPAPAPASQSGAAQSRAGQLAAAVVAAALLLAAAL